jgi:2-polyprenyl-6-methoxyphenol hydroxylase-like FAD-dependent oxidoreductase
MAGALLARCGVGVRVLDKSPSQAKESRAFAVQARTMELFQSLGLAEAFLDKGVLAAGARVYVDGEPAAGFDLDDLGRDDTPFPLMLIIPQSETEAILVDDLDRLGVAVERGIEATSLDQTSDGVVVHARGPGGDSLALRASYVIGADGAHSMVRKALGLTFEGAAYPQAFLLADCKLEGPVEHARLKVFLHGSDFAIVIPMKGQDYARVIATDIAMPVESSLASQGSSPLQLAEVEAALRRASTLDVTLSEPRWTSRYRVHHRGVNVYGRGRAFVAGDAAHIHSPAGGQGMNTGLHDVANLCWKLASVLKGQAPESLLGTYDEERRPVGETVLKFTDRAFSIVTTQSGWAATLRDTLVPILGATIARSGIVRERAFHFISELGIRYEPNAFLARDDRDGAPRAWRRGPAPGHRAPDAMISSRTRLFDLIGGYRFHVLALSRTPLIEADIARLADELAGLREAVGLDLRTHILARSLVGRDPRIAQAELPRIFEAYGIGHDVAQGTYLIRPDGHVAWRTHRLDIGACRRFMLERFRPVTPP